MLAGMTYRLVLQEHLGINEARSYRSSEFLAPN